jgi:hypothetical protein
MQYAMRLVEQVGKPGSLVAFHRSPLRADVAWPMAMPPLD